MRLDLVQAQSLVRAYQRIPIQLADVPIDSALEISASHGIYACDAFVIACAQRYRSPLVTLDRGLERVAHAAGVDVLEVEDS